MQGLFFARRMAICLSLVFWQRFLWAQLCLQLGLSLLIIGVVQQGRSMESRYAKNMATVNEVTILVLIYAMMLFSEYLQSAPMRHSVGFFFIGVVGAHVLLHLGILIYQSGKSAFLRIRYAYYWRRIIWARYMEKCRRLRGKTVSR